MVTTKDPSARQRARARIAKQEEAARAERARTEKDLAEFLTAAEKVAEWEQRAAEPIARLLARKPAAEVAELTQLSVPQLRKVAAKASPEEPADDGATAVPAKPVSEAG